MDLLPACTSGEVAVGFGEGDQRAEVNGTGRLRIAFRWVAGVSGKAVS
jgi:hypothetical protein